MSREPIPEELRRFLLTSVPSVPFVEAMLIYRAARGQPLAVPDLARRLYLGEKAAADLVRQLLEAGIVAPGESPDTHRYAAAGELDARLDMLANFYRTHLVDVTDVIHSRTARRARQFADAFKFRKDP